MPKEKRNKLEAFGKKDIFIYYSENLKASIIHVSGERDVEIGRDFTFHEDTTLGKARDLPISRNENDGAAK